MTAWNDKQSVLTETKDDLGRITYHGTLFFQGIEFRFRINPQNSGKYVYRGSVSAISPADGFVVQVKGHEAARRLGSKQTTECGDTQRRNAKLNLMVEVYTQATNREDVKEAILKAVKKMYIEHAVLLSGALHKSIRPDTITPGIAAVLFADSFVAAHYKNVNEATAMRYAKKIKDVCCEMQSIPMSKYTLPAVKDFLDRHKISNDKHRTLLNFWEYLVLKGHVAGINPVPPVKNKKLSPGNKQQNARKISELTLPQQDLLYDHIMKTPICGGNCGVALLAWGNLPPENEVLKWKDVIMDPERRDYVVIKYHRADLAGATHNFTQPQTIQVARILWKQKDKLLTNYSEHDLLGMPVISLQKNPKKEMKMNSLIQHAGRILRSIGIEEKVFAVQNKAEHTAVAKQILQMTHQKNIYHRFGLEYDEGTKQFMQLESLRKNVTDDNYASYSDSDAHERIYVAQLAIRPHERLHEEEILIESLQDGNTSITASPEHTRERVGVICSVKVPPGATITLHCPHGVSGEYRTREIKEDGTLRRKSKK